MTLRAEIVKQIKNLLSYYPGNGRLAWLWLLVIPMLYIGIQELLFRVWSPGPRLYDVPFYIVLLAPGVAWWTSQLALVMILLRLSHSKANDPRQIALVFFSSVGYALVIFAPAFAIFWLMAIWFVGTSVTALAQSLAGVMTSLGGLLLLATIAGWLASRGRAFVPLLLLIIWSYSFYLPVGYTYTFIPERWRTLHAFALPLAPAIVLLKQGLLVASVAKLMYWMAALTHAAIGFGLAWRLWVVSSRVWISSAPENRPPPSDY